MRVSCPTCEREVVGASISVPSRLATCIACHTVFDISDQMVAKERAQKDGEVAGSAPRQAVREDVDLPHGLRLERVHPAETEGDPYRSAGRSHQAVSLSWPWYHRKHWYTLGFALFWWVLLLLWYIKAGVSGDTLMTVYAIPYCAIGLALGYVSLAIAKNRTTVSVGEEVLAIEHGPIPWPGEKRVPLRELDQIYCQEKVAYRKIREPVMMYALYARLRGGEHIKLTDRLADPEQALYLEQQLELSLGIVDVRVPGQIDKGLYYDPENG